MEALGVDKNSLLIQMQEMTITIDGMSCSSCSDTVEKTILMLNGVEKVDVAISTNSANIIFDASIIDLEKICAAIVDVGFHTNVVKIKPLNYKFDSNGSSEITQLTIGINGMTCSSCSSTVERIISSIDGVQKFSVSLATNSAEIYFNSNIINSARICESIDNIGFDVSIISEKIIRSNKNIELENTIRFLLLSIESIDGIPTKIFPTEKFQNLSTILQGVNGILDVSLIQSNQTIKLQIDETLIGPRQIVQLCHNYNIIIKVCATGGFLQAEMLLAQQKKEFMSQLFLLIISLLLTVPIIIIDMILPLILNMNDTVIMTQIVPGCTVNILIILLLSAPVQFIIGSKFYIKAYKSCLAGTLGMDFLISTGTTAAYFYAFISFIRGLLSGIPNSKDVSFAETSAVLITVVILGKFLETYARRVTSSAIQKLTSFQVDKARLLLKKDRNSFQLEVVPDNNSPLERRSEMKKFGYVLTSDDEDYDLEVEVEETKDKSSNTVIKSVEVDDNTSTYNNNNNYEQYEEQPVDASLLQQGDMIRVLQGESVPADGILMTTSLLSVDESLLTGESRTVDKKYGDPLIGGSTVVVGSGVLRVTACGDNSTLGRIVSSMQQAQQSKPAIQELADSVAKVFIPVVTVISLCTFIVWMSLGLGGALPASWVVGYDNSPLLLAFSFALAVWVSACPCAFGLATPTAIMVATGVAAENGILIRRGASIQSAANVTAVAFDKTGTLTEGQTSVSDYILFLHPGITMTSSGKPTTPSETETETQNEKKGNTTSNTNFSTSNSNKIVVMSNGHLIKETLPFLSVTLLRYLLLVEERSSHPLAAGIVTFCKQLLTDINCDHYDNNISSHELGGSTSMEHHVEAGQGITMNIIYERSSPLATSSSATTTTTMITNIAVGNEELMKANNIELSSDILQLADGLRAGGKVVIYLSVDGVICSVVALTDAVRQEARDVIYSLRKKGIECYMVTGDNMCTAFAIATVLDIPADHIIASSHPDDKKLFITGLQAAGHCVAFVGDGTNDSLALSQSDVGIAMGSGTDLAVEAGDMVLCRNNLLAVIIALDLSRCTLRRIRFNYFWALIYNTFLIPIAAGVLFPVAQVALDPMFAGAAMAISSVSIVTSSLWLRRYNPPKSSRRIYQSTPPRRNKDDSSLSTTHALPAGAGAGNGEGTGSFNWFDDDFNSYSKWKLLPSQSQGENGGGDDDGGGGESDLTDLMCGCPVSSVSLRDANMKHRRGSFLSLRQCSLSLPLPRVRSKPPVESDSTAAVPGPVSGCGCRGKNCQCATACRCGAGPMILAHTLV